MFWPNVTLTLSIHIVVILNCQPFNYRDVRDLHIRWFNATTLYFSISLLIFILIQLEVFQESYRNRCVWTYSPFDFSRRLVRSNTEQILILDTYKYWLLNTVYGKCKRLFNPLKKKELGSVATPNSCPFFEFFECAFDFINAQDWLKKWVSYLFPMTFTFVIMKNSKQG